MCVCLSICLHNCLSVYIKVLTRNIIHIKALAGLAPDEAAPDQPLLGPLRGPGRAGALALLARRHALVVLVYFSLSLSLSFSISIYIYIYIYTWLVVVLWLLILRVTSLYSCRYYLRRSPPPTRASSRTASWRCRPRLLLLLLLLLPLIIIMIMISITI